VVFTNPDAAAYWVNEGQRACRMALDWRSPSGESRGSASLRVLPPVALAPGEMRERRVPVRVPPGSGSVRLASVLTCGREPPLRSSAEASVDLLQEMPPARSADAVEATHERVWAPAAVCSACPLPFRLHTKNTGPTRWPVGGRLRMDASWTDEGGRHVGGASVAIEAGIHPGEETVLDGLVPSPSAPGVYLLGVALVGGPGAAHAAAPFRVTVTAR
jgi:hypothetical protein